MRAARQPAGRAIHPGAMAALALGPAFAGLPDETGALIAHLRARYHAAHRRALPGLVRLAHRVEAVHRDHPQVPRGLGDLLAALERELGEHMMKEEQALFPALLAGLSGLGLALEVMRDEHDALGARLREVETLTHCHAPPAGACASWRALYAGTARFAQDLAQNIRIENDILFARFEE